MEVSSQFIILVPVVLGLTQAVKVAGLDSRWAPLLAIIFGVCGAFLIAGVSGVAFIGGVVAGLTAAGLWSGTKTTIGN